MKKRTRKTKRTKTKTVTTDRFRTTLLRGCVLALLVLFAAGAPAAPAHPSDQPLKSHYALIVATVWAPGNRAAYGVKIQLRRAGNKKVLMESYSDHSGEVAFRVPEGKADYLVTADVKPSKGKTKPEAIVHIENDERAEVSLHLSE